jgi:hypothetical protein
VQRALRRKLPAPAAPHALLNGEDTPPEGEDTPGESTEEPAKEATT